MMDHVGLLLAQCFGKAGSRVVADCSAVLLGFAKRQRGDPSILSYKNPHGGVWAQMGDILKERQAEVVVSEILKVEAHLTK